MKRQELTCLHTHAGGDVWGVAGQGVARPLPGFLSSIPARTGIYRVIGLPENYRLITDLYVTLVDKETSAQLLVGSPQLCPQQTDTVEQVLSCISVLDVHNSLNHGWHRMDSTSYNNFLLLEAYRESADVELLEYIYSYHVTRPLFQFLGLNQPELAVALISMIGDPRWYINPQRPYRLDRLESYFGLHPTQFAQSWDADFSTLPSPRNQRSMFLWKLMRALPPESFVLKEIHGLTFRFQDKLAACRRILGFVARNWLDELTNLGYFDPDVFFRQPEARDQYLRQFRD